ncbi:phosphohydrolase [Anoxybacter fermentans]|uniref:Phosphohydrolase n=1 Tax=Anoxybacter fermentans TaxID=1323375 RepID=A0A3Q9HPK1_9FIRM|nr:HD domain-containing protein [Anoxybacter fermentans]AZR72786.1 phosphohydrolase [Anoxybacter fermentans]
MSENRFKNPLPEEIYLSREYQRKEDIRGPYFRDQTAIIHSLPFRRLKHKTQFFFAPENDHICTRIEHVLHVASIAATICKGLGLNTDLAQAIALGHDLGHAPFGHTGEEVLNEISKEHGFIHELHSLRVVDVLARDGQGLDLTYAVRDGIISHCGERFEQWIEPTKEQKDLSKIKNRATYPTTYEGCVVRVADKISYLGRDLEDAIRAGLVDIKDLPPRIIKDLGRTNGEMIDVMVHDVIKWSNANGKIGFSQKVHSLMVELKEFNYKNIYFHPKLLHYAKYCRRIIRLLYEQLEKTFLSYGLNFNRYKESEFTLERKFGKYLEDMQTVYEREGWPIQQILYDYIAGMTDQYAIKMVREFFIPKPIDSFNSN